MARSKSTMVNVRMDADTIAYLDDVGPTRSDAVRKCVAVAQRDHSLESVRLTPVSISRLKAQRPLTLAPPGVPRETLHMAPLNPVVPPTAEYLEMKDQARSSASQACPHPLDQRLGRKPGPVVCNRCGTPL